MKLNIFILLTLCSFAPLWAQKADTKSQREVEVSQAKEIVRLTNLLDLEKKKTAAANQEVAEFSGLLSELTDVNGRLKERVIELKGTVEKIGSNYSKLYKRVKPIESDMKSEGIMSLSELSFMLKSIKDYREVKDELRSVVYKNSIENAKNRDFDELCALLAAGANTPEKRQQAINTIAQKMITLSEAKLTFENAMGIAKRVILKAEERARMIAQQKNDAIRQKRAQIQSLQDGVLQDFQVIEQENARKEEIKGEALDFLSQPSGRQASTGSTTDNEPPPFVK